MERPAVFATEQPTSRGERYWPELDGLRAVAVLAVIGQHADVAGFGQGWLGVDVFFALSGFLITTVLVNEWAERGGIGLGRFYLRRLLRLYPALVAVVIASIVAALLLGPPYEHDTLVNAPLALTYTSNFANGTGHLSQSLIASVWSLAVEEQFYLLWPLALILLLRGGGTRRALVVTAALVIVSALLRHPIVAIAGGAYAYNALEVRAAQLLLGAAAAVLLTLWSPPRPLVQWSAVAGALVIAGAFVSDRWPVPLWSDLRPPLVALGATLVVVALREPPRWVRVTVGSAPMVAVGRISYGMYLWHFLVIAVALRLWSGLEPGALFAIDVPVTIAIAWCSYRVVELPFLRLKRRLR